MRTFRNVLYVRLKKRYVRLCLWCSLRSKNGRLRLAVRQKLEDAYGCRSRSHANCRRWRRGHAPPVRKPNHNLNQRPPRVWYGIIGF